jgi:hypothetical protein
MSPVFQTQQAGHAATRKVAREDLAFYVPTAPMSATAPIATDTDDELEQRVLARVSYGANFLSVEEVIERLG